MECVARMCAAFLSFLVFFSHGKWDIWSNKSMNMSLNVSYYAEHVVSMFWVFCDAFSIDGFIRWALDAQAHSTQHTSIYYTWISYCSTLPMASPQNYINDRSWHVQMFAFLLCSYIKFMTDKPSRRERKSGCGRGGKRTEMLKTNNTTTKKTPTKNEWESHMLKIRATVRDAITQNTYTRHT